MTFEQFKKFYEEKGFLPNDVGRRKNSLNERQIRTRYKKYLKQEKRKKEKFEEDLKKQREKEYNNTIDEKWENLKKEMDLTKCTLIERLKKEESNVYSYSIQTMKQQGGFLLGTIDPAHVFSRGAYPHLKYKKENVVPLNRFSHSMLDTMRSPITGEQITKKERDSFWKYIVGDQTYNSLKELANKYKRGK